MAADAPRKQVKRLKADLADLKAKLTAVRSERDLMKAVSDELHSKVLELESQMNARASGPPADPGPRIMPADRDLPDEELSEAQARAERLAERVAELRLQLSVFAPDSKEAAARAGQTLARARQTSERIQTLERQLATARAREDSLVSSNVRGESTIADLEARVLEMSGMEARAAEAEIAMAEAEQALMEMQSELMTLRAEAERLKKDRDEARQRAEAERVLAASDRLRADEAQRLVTDMQARSGDVEGALGRIAELELQLAEAVSEVEAVRADQPLEDEAAAPPAIAESQLAWLLAERADLQAMLANAHARLAALEEVAAHAAVLESEMADARASMPEIRIAAEAAARRAAELSEELHSLEAERDALRAALEGRLQDVNALRARVGELEGSAGPILIHDATSEETSAPKEVPEEVPGETPEARQEETADISIGAPSLSQGAVAASQDELRRSGSPVASIWLADGVGGGVDALVDLSDEPETPGSDEPPEDSDPLFFRDEPGDPEGSDIQSDQPEPDMASAGSESPGSGRLRKRGRSGRKPPPEDPTSWT